MISKEEILKNGISEASENLFNFVSELSDSDKAGAILSLEKHVLRCTVLASELLSKIQTDRDVAMDAFGLDEENLKKVVINLIESNNLLKN